jgi:hypothetical protein
MAARAEVGKPQARGSISGRARARARSSRGGPAIESTPRRRRDAHGRRSKPRLDPAAWPKPVPVWPAFFAPRIVSPTKLFARGALIAMPDTAGMYRKLIATHDHRSASVGKLQYN